MTKEPLFVFVEKTLVEYKSKKTLVDIYLCPCLHSNGKISISKASQITQARYYTQEQVNASSPWLVKHGFNFEVKKVKGN